MSDKLLQLLHKHDRYKFPKSNMSRTVADVFPIDQSQLFKPRKVEDLIREILDEEVDESLKYSAEDSMKLCTDLADKVRIRVKDLNFERYKIVCLVQIFEKKNQSILSVVRLLSDVERDRYCIVKKENNYLFVIVSAYGLYYP